MAVRSARDVSPASVAVIAVALLVTCATAYPAQAQLLNPPQVLLEVHPNERAEGPEPVFKDVGGPFWVWPVPTSNGRYQCALYQFAGSGSLLIQVTAQCFAAWQNKPISGFGTEDRLTLIIDGTTPTDYWGVQTGPAAYQWNGAVDRGNKLTLEFIVTGLNPGLHQLRFDARMSPIIWWIKVYDLEPRVLE